MIYIILLALLLNTSMFYSTLFNKKIGHTILYSIISYIITLYLFGIFNALYIGLIITLIANAIILGYNIYCLKEKKIKFKENIMTFGLVLFLIAYLIIIWSSLGKVASSWDEFSHWALAVKNMFELNNLGLGNDSTISIKTYLSGTSIFQYFCVALSGKFNESLLYLAMNVLLLSLIIPAFEGFDKVSKFIKVLLFIAMFFLPTLFYPTIYSSLYVDGVLALTFSYGLYSYFINRKKQLNYFDTSNLIFCFIMLIFVKDFGLILAMLLLMIVLIDNAFIQNKFDFKHLIKNNYKIVLTIVPAMLIKLSWIITLAINKIESGNQGTGILTTIINLLKQNIQDYQKDVILTYSSAIGTTNLTNTKITISFFTIIVLLFLIGYLIYRNVQKTDQKRIITYTISTIVSSIIYAGILLLCYISIFSEYEAIRLASYDRYINSFALGALFAFIIILMNSISKDKLKLEKYVITLFVIVSVIIKFDTLLSFFSGPLHNTSQGIRNQYNTFETKVKKYLKSNDKLYFISTNDSGFDYFVARYEITPIVMKDVWSIGKPYDENDIWTKNIPIENVKTDLIKNYEYVYLYDIDEQFIKIYGDLFADDNIKDNQIYKVNKETPTKLLSFIE